MKNQEIEAKFYVENLSNIESRLQMLNAKLIQARVLESNLRFDTPDHTLRSGGRVLRLRQDNQTRLTYKGPDKNEPGVLSRDEIEFIVENYEKAKLFLESLGYEQLFYYEKYRTTYELGGTHVMLDELPYGNFVEVEGEDAETIREMVGKLGLRLELSIAASYHALYERVAKAHNLTSNELSFGLFNELHISIEELGVQPAD